MEDVKSKIKSFLNIKGPSLPVHLAKQVGLSSIFTGAFLSEMVKDKEILISNMKVGGSPLYYLKGQEEQLERFYNYLPQKEKEAFLLLKEKGLLLDKEQDPPIRFALRQIKDFSFGFYKDSELFWKFHSIPDSEINAFFEKQEKKKQEKEQNMKIEEKQPKREEKIVEIKEKQIKEQKQEKLEEKQQKEKPKQEREKPLLELKEVKKKKKKDKSWFVLRVIEFLNSQDIEILEEISWKKREYQARVRINSDLGKIKFFLLAKDKKSITENDLALTYNKAQENKLPALVISKSNLNKKGEKYLEEWSSLIKFIKIP